MNKATEHLIEYYKREYERVNGRVPEITVKGGWIQVDNLAGCKYRPSELAKCLAVLRTRADYHSKP